jgi:hypothetical protein
MKINMMALVLFVAGLSASLAFAGSPAGKGNGGDASISTGTRAPGQRVTLCHLTGSKSHPYVKVTVSRSAVTAHLRRGDVTRDAAGCHTPGA